MSAFLLSFLISSIVVATPYYKHIFSPIPSGEENIDILREKTKTGKLTNWVQVQVSRPNKKLWLHEPNIIYGKLLSQVVKTKSPSTGRRSPMWNASANKHFIADELLKVSSHTGEWLNIKTTLGTFIHNSEVKAISDDIGKLITKRPTEIKSAPDSQSSGLEWVPEFKYFNVLKFSKAWAQVSTRKGLGYIELKDCITKLDFAKEIFVDKKWYDVRSYIAGNLLTTKNQWVLPEQVAAIKLHEDQGILLTASAAFSNLTKSNSTVHSLPAFAKLKITNKKEEFWGQVKLKGHGWVWWTEPKNKLVKKTTKNTNIELGKKRKQHILGQIENQSFTTITNRSLFKRKIFDMASSPLIPELRFASASGIFWSIDGKRWNKIEKFKNENHPIAFSPEGKLYIGNFSSDDHGQNFTPYIRWEKIVAAISNNSKGNHGLRLVGIDILDKVGKDIQLKVETNGKKFIVISDNHGKSWNLSQADLSDNLL